MCGRFALFHPWSDLLAAYRLAGYAVNIPPRFNIAPTQGIVGVLADTGGTRRLEAFEWGLIPSWAKERRAGPPLIHARAETVADKPSFRHSFRRRRCLIPASGFYEWRETAEKGPKQPFWIAPVDEGLISFAGIWDQWLAPDGGEVLSCALITTTANDSLRGLHHRMPVIVAPGDHDAWLDVRDETDTRAAASLMKPAPDDLLHFHPVSREVNAVRNDDASLIEPASPEPGRPEPQSEPPREPAPAETRQGDLFF